MREREEQETTEEGLPPTPDDGSTPDDGFGESARRWHEELKQQEGSIAPWLNLEWTGEDMDVKRG